MNREEIITALKEKHNAFIDYTSSLTDEEFSARYNEKWTAGQQLDHIYRSVKPLREALLLPKFMLKLVFGKANRPSRTYEAVVEKYSIKLESGGKASSKYTPNSIGIDQKEGLSKSLLKNIKKLSTKINAYTEQELDLIILPHPLLGKLTLREMLYFTIYHVEHHTEIIKRNLRNSQN